MTETVVAAEVLSEVRGQVGFITLNRPRALNALSLGMVRDLMATLLAWQADDRVLAVAQRELADKAEACVLVSWAVWVSVRAAIWAALKLPIAPELRLPMAAGVMPAMVVGWSASIWAAVKLAAAVVVMLTLGICSVTMDQAFFLTGFARDADLAARSFFKLPAMRMRSALSLMNPPASAWL